MILSFAYLAMLVQDAAVEASEGGFETRISSYLALESRRALVRCQHSRKILRGFAYCAVSVSMRSSQTGRELWKIGSNLFVPPY